MIGDEVFLTMSETTDLRRKDSIRIGLSWVSLGSWDSARRCNRSTSRSTRSGRRAVPRTS